MPVFVKAEPVHCARCQQPKDVNGLRICTECLDNLDGYNGPPSAIHDFAQWLAGYEWTLDGWIERWTAPKAKEQN